MNENVLTKVWRILAKKSNLVYNEFLLRNKPKTMMRDMIIQFPKQFSFDPKVENKGNLVRKRKYVVGGMGGSGLPGELLSSYYKEHEIVLYRDYGIPETSRKKLREYGFIAVSYSGNTEETLDFFLEAKRNKFPLAALTTGGKLLDEAMRWGIPFVRIPSTGIQPRMALGYMLLGLMKIMGDTKGISEIQKLGKTLKPKMYEAFGQKLASFLQKKIPIIYSSRTNSIIGYIWKIKLNETGKIPAFQHVFPELNHNEMTSFDRQTRTKEISENFCFIFLEDTEDHPRIQKRMGITKKLFKDRGLEVISVKLEGKSRWQKVFQSILLADWVSLSLATTYQVEAEQVPMVEELKKLMV